MVASRPAASSVPTDQAEQAGRAEQDAQVKGTQVKGTQVKGTQVKGTQASWAMNRHLQVRLSRVRGGKAGAVVRLEIDSISGNIQTSQSQPGGTRHEQAAVPASTLHLASQLAGATRASQRSAAG